jgi:hypothetical protein
VLQGESDVPLTLALQYKEEEGKVGAEVTRLLQVDPKTPAVVVNGR